MIKLCLLGATGSIGTSCLKVLEAHPERIELVALSVHTQVEKAAALAQRYHVAHVAISGRMSLTQAEQDLFPSTTTISFGADALYALTHLDEVTHVLNAIVGFAGLDAGYHALLAKKTLAYANKESIVCGGDLLMPLAAPGQLIPVDSEHSAIFQCLVGEKNAALKTIWLTCSGGPFFGKSRDELAQVTVDDALAHPTWNMGAKITIDSATLMNKGLEVLEARQLFGVSLEQIKVLIHRESKIHSMVEFTDGSVKAQLGPSEMAIPIQYALSYPDRWEAPVASINWCESGPLSFYEADEKSFRCLALALEAGKRGGSAPTVLNAANELANAAFRSRLIKFTQIDEIIELTLNAIPAHELSSLDDVKAVDAEARAYAQMCLEQCR